MWVDDILVIDNWTRQRRGKEFFNCGTEEETGIVELKANTYHKIYIEFCNVRSPADGDEDEAVMDSNPGVRLGGAEVLNEDDEMAKAVKLAEEADVVIAVVGLNADWETEGYDRTTLSLPRRTDELIQKISKVNKKTIVVTQSVMLFHCPLPMHTEISTSAGICDRHAMGGFRPYYCPFVVFGQCYWRGDRRCPSREEESVRQIVDDFPQAH